jgi:formylglycine-generating enzyme required for sulfatase activity
MKQKIILGTITFFILVFFVFSQDIKMEVVKEKYQVLPLFALGENGEAVTDLEKADVEFLLNGQNSREFLLFKKTLTRSGAQNLTKEVYSEAAGLKMGKVIILLFDNLFADKRSLNEFSDIARHIVLQTDDRVKYIVLTTDSTSVSFSAMSPNQNKNATLRKIKDKVITGPSYMYNPDVKMKLFSQTFEKLHQPIKQFTDNKILYFFTTGAPKGDWGDYMDRAAIYLEQVNAVLLFINPVNTKTDNGENFIPSLANKSGGRYIRGNKNGIIKDIDNLHRSYYEIVIPGLKEFTGSLRQIQISSSRKHVALHMTKGVKRIRDRGSAAQHAARQDLPLNTSRQEFHDTKTQVKRKVQSEEKISADRLISEKKIAHVQELLTTNRFNLERATSKLLCGEALIYLNQGRINNSLEQLQRILETTETNTGFIHEAVEELEKILRKDNGIERTLRDVMRFRQRSKHNNVLKLHNKVDEILGRISVNEDAAEITLTALKKMQEIISQARERTGFVESALHRLSGYWEIGKTEVHNPNYSKAENYLRILTALENEHGSGSDAANGSKNSIRKILSHFKKAAAEAVEYINFVESAIQKIEDIDKAAGSDFVIGNNDQFSLKYRKNFFKKKLASLGADPALLNNPDFIDVVSFATHFNKNSKGYWEGLFDNDTVLIYVPAGKFTMGLPWESGGAQDESPRHEVFLTGFWIAKFETTFKQFDHFCDTYGRGKPVDSDFGRKNRPAVNISWKDSDTYCKWLSERTGLYFRLPTEAEWEKAARSSAEWKYPWGNAKPDGEKANFADRTLFETYKRNHPGEAEEGKLTWMDKKSEDGCRATAPVGKYPEGASPYGVMDMAGNVWEFVMDWYDGDYYQRSPAKNPAGPYRTGYKTIRGGGWDSHHWMLRTTTRAGGIPGRTSDVVGFRIAVGTKFE